MESNSNKTLQQKTFNKKTHEKVHTNPKTNVSLTQKTFKQQGEGGKVKKNTTYKKKNRLQNILVNVSKTRYKHYLVYLVWIVIFGVLNFEILYKWDFRVSTGADWVYLIVMLGISIYTGLSYFINELEKRDGYILKYLVATIIGICGNFLGLLVSVIGCGVIYVIFGIVKWFVG